MFCDGKSTMLIEVGDASEHTCTDELSVCTCVAEVCVSLEMFFFSLLGKRPCIQVTHFLASNVYAGYQLGPMQFENSFIAGIGQFCQISRSWKRYCKASYPIL